MPKDEIAKQLEKLKKHAGLYVPAGGYLILYYFLYLGKESKFINSIIKRNGIKDRFIGKRYKKPF